MTMCVVSGPSAVGCELYRLTLYNIRKYAPLSPNATLSPTSERREEGGKGRRQNVFSKKTCESRASGWMSLRANRQSALLGLDAHLNANSSAPANGNPSIPTLPSPPPLHQHAHIRTLSVACTLAYTSGSAYTCACTPADGTSIPRLPHHINAKTLTSPPFHSRQDTPPPS